MTLNAVSPSFFTEKLAAGSQVITIAYVEEVIARMGKPEELEPDAASGSGSWDGSNHAGNTGAGASRNCGESVSPFLSQSRR